MSDASRSDVVSLEARRAEHAARVAARATRNGQNGPPREAVRETPRETVVAHSGRRPAPAQVTFERRELDAILQVYSFKVAEGEWRDYAIDLTRESAVFSVYRRSSESPLYRIVKNPKLARRQGAWAVTSQSGQVLKRGHDLARVLEMFRRRLRLVE